MHEQDLRIGRRDRITSRANERLVRANIAALVTLGAAIVASSLPDHPDIAVIGVSLIGLGWTAAEALQSIDELLE